MLMNAVHRRNQLETSRRVWQWGANYREAHALLYLSLITSRDRIEIRSTKQAVGIGVRIGVGVGMGDGRGTKQAVQN